MEGIVCRWRSTEPLPNGNHVCGSPNWHAPFGVSEEHCRTRCPSRDHVPTEEAIKAKLTLLKVMENPGEQSPPRGHLRCQHLREPTGERILCETCAGNVEIKIMGCTRHSRCTPHKKLEGIMCCTQCPDYVAKEDE